MPQTKAWDDELLTNPHAVADKRRRVQEMFAAIAPSYDLNNRLHSLWMDQRWRRRAVNLATLKPVDIVVDANSFVNTVCKDEPAILDAHACIAQRHDVTVEPTPIDVFDSHDGGSYHALRSRGLARV